MSALPNSSVEDAREAYRMRRIYIGLRLSDAMRELSRRHPILSCGERYGRPVGKRKIPRYAWKTVSRVVKRTTPKGKIIERERQVRELAKTGEFDTVPVYEAVCEADWRWNSHAARRAEAKLNAAVDLFCRGKVGTGVVKSYYRRFAEAHTVWWKEGAYSNDPTRPPPEPDF